MKNIYQHIMTSKFALPIIFITLPSTSFAHVQWFVSPDEMKQVAFQWDWLYSVITALILSCSLVGIAVTRHSYRLGIFHIIIAKSIKGSRPIYSGLFTALTVLFFLLLVLRGGFIAPNLNLPNNWISMGVFLQGLIVLTACFSVSLSGVAILLTTAFMAWHIPFVISINYLLEFTAVGGFMTLTGHYISKNDHKVVEALGMDHDRMWILALFILRVGIGLQLAILAYTEKLAFPGLALVFVEMFPFYNFFPIIGFNIITDIHFVYFVGLCELLLGLLLAFGITNRLAMILLSFAFITTSFIHGSHEVEGHLPIFGAAIVLLFELSNRPVASQVVNSRKLEGEIS